MKTKWFGLTMCLLAFAPSSWAGENVQLDKDFSFRLTQPDLPPPPAAPAPTAPPGPKRQGETPLKTPEGVPLPPGSRALQFNGQTFYFIPL